jgi:hypothetical protein
MAWKSIGDALEKALIDAMTNDEGTAGQRPKARPTPPAATTQGGQGRASILRSGEGSAAQNAKEKTGSGKAPGVALETCKSLTPNSSNVRSMATVFTRRPAKSRRRRSAVVIDLMLVRAQRHAAPLSITD